MEAWQNIQLTDVTQGSTGFKTATLGGGKWVRRLRSEKFLAICGLCGCIGPPHH